MRFAAWLGNIAITENDANTILLCTYLVFPVCEDFFRNDITVYTSDQVTPAPRRLFHWRKNKKKRGCLTPTYAVDIFYFSISQLRSWDFPHKTSIFFPKVNTTRPFFNIIIYIRTIRATILFICNNIIFVYRTWVDCDVSSPLAQYERDINTKFFSYIFQKILSGENMNYKITRLFIIRFTFYRHFAYYNNTRLYYFLWYVEERILINDRQYF